MKITKLTKQEKERMEKVKNYWIDLMLHSGDAINKKDATEGILWLYSHFQKEKPQIIFVDSPLGVQYALNFLSAWDSAWRGVEHSVEHSVENSVRNSVGDSAWDSVWDSVWRSVRDSVGDSVRKNKLRFFELNWQNILNYGRVAFYDYFDEFGIYDQQTKKNFDKYKKILQSGVFIFAFYKKCAVLSRRPKFIKKEEGRLHSLDSAAIGWRDGFELYFIDNIEFTKDLWEKVVNKKLSAQEAIKLENIEQRTIALKILGWEKVLSELKAKVIYEDQWGEILEVDLKDHTRPARFLKFQDPAKNNETGIIRIRPEFNTTEEALTHHYQLGLVNKIYSPDIRV